MRHNRKRVLRFTEERSFWVRCVRAWRNLLPDWTPTLDDHKRLEMQPHEHRAAVAIVADGWGPNDPRWDVLMALLEWERREAAEKEQTRQLFEDFRDRMEERYPGSMQDPDPAVVPLTVVKGGEVLSEGETTVETPLRAFFLDKVVPVRHLSEKRER